MSSFDRRDFLRLTGTAVATGVLASGCTGSTAGGEQTSGGGTVKVGLLLPESGVYAKLGEDQRSGWNLYLKLHGGKLGGRDVEVITADEGEKPETAVESAKRLIDREQVSVVVGIISSASLIAIQDRFTKAKIPLISTNASPAPVQGKKYGWRTSYVNHHPSVAFGEYVAKRAGGPVTMIVADYAAGHDHLTGLQKTFKPAGGELAGEPILAPFPIGGKSFKPYLQQIEQQDPAAVYCFFAGADAVKFVKEYKSSGLADKYQLYAPGWLTEGAALSAQGEAALGILNSNNYSPDLDNAANRQFVAAYQKEYNTSPTGFSLAAYDAGWVLDRAIAGIRDDVTSERVEEEIGKVGQIDSPRGPWEFGRNRSPVQTWYLREVKKDGDVLANVVIDELGTLGDDV